MGDIMYIDADPTAGGAISALLEGCHVVHHSQSAVDAFRLAHLNPPDLILIGGSTLDLDPFETTLRFRADAALDAIPVLLIGDSESRRASHSAGADGFLEHPPDRDSLLALVAQNIGAVRQRVESHTTHDLRQHSHRIAERLEAQVIALQEANQRLEEFASRRRQFLRNVSHELATPMTPIVGYLKLLVGGELGPLQPLQQKGVLAVQRSVFRLQQLIDTVLDLSAIERGQLHFYHRAYDFGEMADRAVRCVRETSGFPLEVHVRRHGDNFKTHGDPDKVRRAMLHMLENAAKFSPRGAPLRVDILRDGKFLEFSVLDEGPGIALSEQEKIFEAFYQVDGSTTRGSQGVGLGLSFGRQVARGMGGELLIESPPQGALQGSYIRFRVQDAH